jgi:hypothetical protein
MAIHKHVSGVKTPKTAVMMFGRNSLADHAAAIALPTDRETLAYLAKCGYDVSNATVQRWEY